MPDPATPSAVPIRRRTSVRYSRALGLLNAGVTTVRDLGDRNGLVTEFCDAVRAGRSPGPRVLAAGTPLTGPGGHCW